MYRSFFLVICNLTPGHMFYKVRLEGFALEQLIIHFKQLTLNNNLVRFSFKIGTCSNMKTHNAQTPEFFDDDFLHDVELHIEFPPHRESPKCIPLFSLEIRPISIVKK